MSKQQRITKTVIVTGNSLKELSKEINTKFPNEGIPASHIEIIRDEARSEYMAIVYLMD